ncbi:MAG: hypothetical protein GF387_02530 [Candidatus Portnoybacteria bacterium]|nr:hypothetical protein [Candidatus Portnoybacteria bacterium]
MSQEKNQNKIDLDQSLNNSGPESENTQKSSNAYISPTAPSIVRFLIKYSGGLIKSEKQATYIILILIIISVLISILLIFKGTNQNAEEVFAPPAEAPIEDLNSSEF